MSKTKHNIEYQFIDGYKVVDPVNVASHQKPIYVDGSGSSVTLDLSSSNFFIIDLEDDNYDLETDLEINFQNYEKIKRFEVLLIEPFGKRNIIWNDGIVIFPITPVNKMYEEEFEMRKGERREMLITFKTYINNNELNSKGVPSCWFSSRLLECIVEFNITVEGNPYEQATININHAASSTDNIEIKTNSEGFAFTSIIRDHYYTYSISYTISSNSFLYNGSISQNDSDDEYLLITHEF